MLLLGDVATPPAVTLQWTPLLKTAAHYYIVRLEALRLGGQQLDLQRVRPLVKGVGFGCMTDC